MITAKPNSDKVLIMRTQLENRILRLVISKVMARLNSENFSFIGKSCMCESEFTLRSINKATKPPAKQKASASHSVPISPIIGMVILGIKLPNTPMPTE